MTFLHLETIVEAAIVLGFVVVLVRKAWQRPARLSEQSHRQMTERRSLSDPDMR